MKAEDMGGFMDTVLEHMKSIVEVNTVVGDAVETVNGTVIIPVSKLCCGFASGGTCFSWNGEMPMKEEQKIPFGGGAGAGVSLQPVGFLLVGKEDIRFQVVDHNAIYDRLLDEVTSFLERRNRNKNDGAEKKRSRTQLLEQWLQKEAEQGTEA